MTRDKLKTYTPCIVGHNIALKEDPFAFHYSKAEVDALLDKYDAVLRDFIGTAKDVNEHWRDDSTLWDALISCVEKAEALCQGK